MAQGKPAKSTHHRHLDVTDWLKERNRKDAISNVGMALVLFAVGILLMCWLFPISYFGARELNNILTLMGSRLAVRNDPTADSLMPLVAVSLLGFLFWGNVRWLPQYTGRIPETLAPQVEITVGVLFAGPWLINASRLALMKAWRLWRMDVRVCAEILEVLMRTGHRVTFTQLAGELRGGHAVEALPQLRDLDGVVFLTKDPAGVSLTDEMRRELWDWLPTPEDLEDEEPRFTRRAKARPRAQQAKPPPPPPKPKIRPHPLHAEYAVLGVAEGAPFDEVKAAYRRLLKECHPDRFATLGTELQSLAGERTRKVIGAYEALLKYHRNQQSNSNDSRAG